MSICRLLKILPRVLSVKALLTTAADKTEFFVVLFFQDNKAWHFMWTVCLADKSHETSRLVLEKNNNKKIRMLIATIVLSALRVKVWINLPESHLAMRLTTTSSTINSTDPDKFNLGLPCFLTVQLFRVVLVLCKICLIFSNTHKALQKHNFIAQDRTFFFFQPKSIHTFLISPWKHTCMLCVLIRRASPRPF